MSRTIGQPSLWCQAPESSGSSTDTIVWRHFPRKQSHLPRRNRARVPDFRITNIVRTAFLGVGSPRPIVEFSRVRRGGPGLRCFGYGDSLEFKYFINFVRLFLTTGRTPKMKNLAFLVSPRCRFVGRAFRFDAGYKRRYGNRVLAMET